MGDNQIYTFGAFDNLLYIKVTVDFSSDIDSLLRGLPEDLHLSDKTQVVQKFSFEKNSEGKTVIGVLVGTPKVIFHR